MAKQKKSMQEAIEFPEILKQRIAQLNVEMGNAIREVMGLMSLEAGEWLVDLQQGVFVKNPPPEQEG